MPSIELKNLKVTYYTDTTSTIALNDVNVIFPLGKSTAVIGPSGCGKTTLIRTICGFLDYEGMIEADGEDYSTFDYKKRNISYVDQSVTLNPNSDIYSFIAEPLIINKVKRFEIDQRIKEVAAELGISRYLPLFPVHLSKGQSQLVLLAKALVKKPSLLLLDEAFSSLDSANKKRFIDYIKKMQKEYPLTVIFVTHDSEEVIELADYVLYLEDGIVKFNIDRSDKKFSYIKEIMENNSVIL